jgi:glycosyltransferase involved in cell wall biosynthesis
MTLTVNGRFFNRPITGVERYAGEILRHMPDRLRVIQPGWRQSGGAAGHAWEQFILPKAIHGSDLLWSPANTGPVSIVNQVLVLHDLSMLEHPEWYAPPFSLWYRLFLPILLKRVRKVIVPSHFVRGRLLRRFRIPPPKVVVIPGGVDRERFHSRRLVPSGAPARYFLFVGSLQPRKNLCLIFQAWRSIFRRFPDTWLLVAGGARPHFSPVALPAALPRVRFLGYVPEADLPGYYAGAQFLVIPSFEEGFGLPALEAMAVGLPVISARAGALPEVIAQAGLFIDPGNAAELAGAMTRLLTEKDLRRDLAERGLEQCQKFSWQRSAIRTWEVFQECL